MVWHDISPHPLVSVYCEATITRSIRLRPVFERARSPTAYITFSQASSKPNQIMTCYAVPHHVIPYHTISCHTMPYQAIPYHTIPYHAIPYHTIKYQTMPANNITAVRMAHHYSVFHVTKGTGRLPWRCARRRTPATDKTKRIVNEALISFKCIATLNKKRTVGGDRLAMAQDIVDNGGILVYTALQLVQVETG